MRFVYMYSVYSGFCSKCCEGVFKHETLIYPRILYFVQDKHIEAI